MGNRPVSCVHCGGRRVCYQRTPTKLESASGGLPAPLLRKKLYDAAIVVTAISMDLAEGHLDLGTQDSVVKVCCSLHLQATVALACLFSVCESLSDSSASTEHKELQKNFAAQLAVPDIRRPALEAIRSGAFECLSQIGKTFENLVPALESTRLVARCKTRRIDCHSDSAFVRHGKHLGQAYMNTWENDDIVTSTDKEAAYNERVAKFLEKGSFSGITTLRQRTGLNPLADLVTEQWYDYVVMLDLSVRCYPARRRGAVSSKCGHTLLAAPVEQIENATFSSSFAEQPVVMAGDLLVVSGVRGTLEALVITNNSGHYRPYSSDLLAAVPAFERLGVPRKNICCFGGPNYIRAIHEAASSTSGLSMLLAGGEPEPRKLLASWMEQS